jgi:asparagine synthase (glutamine-hydrolysing)
MCGIVGLIDSRGGPIDAATLDRMGATLRHRGPDGEGQLIDGSVGLHHRRLAIIDLVTGQQPMTHGPFSIAFNGEIYNYIELREELRAKGHRFVTTSDTEVILHLYEEYGPNCLGRLNGIFAFLLYDRAAGEVLAARDHFGVKPLYVAHRPGLVAYASEIKALLQHPAIAAEPAWEHLPDYVTFQLVLGEGTLFRGVQKLLPGTCQRVQVATGRVETVRYWEPTFVVDAYHTEQYFVDKVRELLEDAVRLQLRSDVPVGCHLSGGMDSSIVTALAARQCGGRLRTFTGGFREGPEFDESEYARAMARACGADPYEIFPTDRDFVEAIPRIIYHMDEPAAGPGVFPQYEVSRLAARHVKVVLGGQGGDEVFGGYARYVVAYLEQALKGAIFETNEEGEHIVSLKSILPNLPYLRQYVPLLRQFWRSEVFEPMDRRYFRLVDRSAGALSLYSRDFRKQVDSDALFQRFAAVFNHPDTQSYYNKMTHFDLTVGLPALLHVEDRVSMAASLESRVPLLDPRLADLVTSAPPAMKFRGAELKYVLKRAAGDLLPAVVRGRKDKMGFPVPLHRWVDGPAGEFIRDTLLSAACRTRGLFDPVAVERMIASDTAFSRRVWGLLNLELWFQTVIDRRPTPPAPPPGPRSAGKGANVVARRNRPRPRRSRSRD